MSVIDFNNNDIYRESVNVFNSSVNFLCENRESRQMNGDFEADVLQRRLSWPHNLSFLHFASFFLHTRVHSSLNLLRTWN